MGTYETDKDLKEREIEEVGLKVTFLANETGILLR